jgi:hypothetical protein
VDVDPPQGARAVREGTELRGIERGGRRVVTTADGGSTIVVEALGDDWS